MTRNVIKIEFYFYRRNDILQEAVRQKLKVESIGENITTLKNICELKRKVCMVHFMERFLR